MWKHIKLERYITALASMLNSPAALAFLPAISLAAFWLGGERALVVVALGLPLICIGAAAFDSRTSKQKKRPRLMGGLLAIDSFAAELEGFFDTATSSGSESACVLVALDDYSDFLDHHGNSAANHLADQFSSRILTVIRSQDVATRLEPNKIAIGLHPSHSLDLEACIQMAGRIQAVVEEPFALNGAGVYASCSIGFCLVSSVAGGRYEEWIDAASAALSEAQRNGPSTIRAFSSETQRRSRLRANLRRELEAALDNGEIRPWFQPQVSTDTGQVTGFEALARWEHPQKGILGPQVFLPFAEQAELMVKFGQTMRRRAFAAMRDWDRAGIAIPRIGVNFSSDELRDPALIDRLKWELDQNDLAPDRLAVEILETVFSRRPDDVITRNVTGMAKLGCCIDLDDFGTGHASIASIKRFDVRRIKIDRSFVAKADRDASQQQLVSAILTMAERLNVETLAEGVETRGEHALMAQLGCNHVQGFGIGKPMPFENTFGWIAEYQSKITAMPKIERKTGH